MNRYKVTARVIKDIKPHPRADSLELYLLNKSSYDYGEFICIQEKGYFQIGELGVLFEPGSNLPDLDWTKPYRKYLIDEKVKKISIRGVQSLGILEKLHLTVNDPYIDIHKDVHLDKIHLEQWLRT